LVSIEALKDLLSQPGFSKTEKVLICLAVEIERPKPIWEIRKIAFKNGLRAATQWDISKLLSRSKGKATLLEKGWRLTTHGADYIKGIISPFVNLPVAKATTNLRSHLDKISDPDTRLFIDEAIKCCEFGLWRAAVVLSWVGAVSVLYDFVTKNKLSEFNVAALRRKPDWKPAKTKDHLGRMKESEFLQVIGDISLIGKNEKKELDHRLEFRNACGHPSSLKIGEHQVASHIEFLILNVFSKFPLDSKTAEQSGNIFDSFSFEGFFGSKK
jgi:hypothetical protein